MGAVNGDPTIDGRDPAGKTFGVAKNDAILGPAVVSYLAGVQAKAGRQEIRPETPEQTDVQNAAVMLLEAFPELDVRQRKRRNSAANTARRRPLLLASNGVAMKGQSKRRNKVCRINNHKVVIHKKTIIVSKLDTKKGEG